MAASLVITRTVRNAVGNLVDLPSPPVLRDPTAAYGLRRDDTEGVILAAGTEIPRVSLGTYSLQVNYLVAGVLYRYWIETTLASGGVSRVQKTWSAPIEIDAPCYLTIAEAAALAEQLPPTQTSHYTAAATDAIRLAALVAATAAIDSAIRYQGRKYDPAQVLEFPRLDVVNGNRVIDVNANGVAIVPRNVLLATLLQANWLLSSGPATVQRIQDAVQAGLASQSVGGMSESYRDVAAMIGSAAQVCTAAFNLLNRYRLITGGIR